MDTEQQGEQEQPAPAVQYLTLEPCEETEAVSATIEQAAPEQPE